MYIIACVNKIVMLVFIGSFIACNLVYANSETQIASDFVAKGPWIDVRAVGAKGDGITDDGPAIRVALATGKLVVLPIPAGGSYKIVGNLDLSGTAGIVGIGSAPVILKFFNCTSKTTGAVTINKSAVLANIPLLENLYLLASSWNRTTGALGYGLEATRPYRAMNVVVDKFAKSNIWLHHDMTRNGPYQTYMENVRSTYSGQHGILIGNGANNITLVNFQGKWNGSTKYGIAPTTAGTYDGFRIDATSDGGRWPAYTPESLTIINGDCSYNSRYGWAFSAVANSSSIFPGYAEGNLGASGDGKQIYIGRNLQQSNINFAGLSGGAKSITIDSYSSSAAHNTIWVGGQYVPYATFNYLIRNMYTMLAETADSGKTSSVYTYPNAGTGGVGLQPYGKGYLRIGTGAKQLEVAANLVALPSIHYKQVTDPVTVSNVTSNGGLIQINSNDHGLTSGDYVYLFDVEGVTAANGLWAVKVIDANNFILHGSAIAGSWTSSTGSWVKVLGYSFDKEPPISGIYPKGFIFYNTAISEQGKAGSKYVIQGWQKSNSGNTNILGADWWPMRYLTGN